MGCEAFEIMILDFGLKNASKTFHHEKKKEGGEGVSLSDPMRRLKGFRSSVIHNNGEEGGGDKGVDLVDLMIIEAKCS